MSDQEFLQYCGQHCCTERAGFTPAQIARLLRMVGLPALAACYDRMPNQVLDGHRDDIRKMLDMVR